MAFIARQKVGNHVYLYEAVSYRNREGKPRSKRVPIGKLDETAPAIGLPGILQDVFPGTWRELFDLACFILSNGEPFMYGCQKPTPFPPS
jgi:hypothetical protein